MIGNQQTVPRISPGRHSTAAYGEQAVVPADRTCDANSSSSPPEVAVLVSSFQRPGHLQRALLSISLQRGIDGRFEVIVTDDGSDAETMRVVSTFASQVDFSVRLTTHRHEAFQLARSRNEGAIASTAPYLIYVDGDCILPPDHILHHLQRRRPGTVLAGDCCRFDEATSCRIDAAAIRDMAYLRWVPAQERIRLARQYRKARWYTLLRHPRKPSLVGANIGIWRSDLERVNGFDEDFRGWGCEDDDLSRRLRCQGVRIASLLKWTCTYHLWHPPDPTYPNRWREGANVGRLRDQRRPAFCRKGLVHLDMIDQEERKHMSFVDAPQPVLSRPPFVQVAYPAGSHAAEVAGIGRSHQRLVA
ncbi:MAG: galactosyltransferase-related protein [Planctomycetes bacterium]|nr:galactosyltransferase-related protein [Planctomycetota bacterium]